ncbi:MAG TPA: hypothetical protein VK641_15845 [Terriglobales bacterium]|nr:hypothetical protein [Terriglobales bacterium]
MAIKESVALCPTGRDLGTSVGNAPSVDLDTASLLIGLLAWLLIGVSNAVLYAIPGTFVAVVVRLWKSN